jgi:hypothetical protein
MKIGRGVRKGCCLSLILCNLYIQYLNNKALQGFGTFKIGQIIHTVKYTDHLVPVAMEDMVLQSMTDRLTEIRRCYGREMNVEKAI